jgi:glucose/arabinose dehydrogenase
MLAASVLSLSLAGCGGDDDDNDDNHVVAPQPKDPDTVVAPPENPKSGAVVSTLTSTIGAIDTPVKIAVGPDGSIYATAKDSHKIHKIAADGAISTWGTGSASTIPVNGPCASATFNQPEAIAVDKDGNVYVGEKSFIRKITPACEVSTLAGNFIQASFHWPQDVAVNAQSVIYVADTANHRIRKITPAD